MYYISSPALYTVGVSAHTYSQICIIYNPNSTSGTAQKRAEALYKRLKKRDIKNIRLIATEYGGHAEELAYAIASKKPHPLIVSVSGDGGYNEIINGALKAQDEDPARRPVCAILAAGNANDHHQAVRKQTLTRAILHSEPEAIDVLRLHTLSPNLKLTRYAHSYIGLGLTSEAAAKLNQEKLNRFKELRIVLRTVLSFRYFTIKELDGNVLKLDSLVFANIHKMSKVFRLGSTTELHNGLFRVISLPHHSLLYRLGFSLRVMLFGMQARYSKSAYEFSLPQSLLVHFDGEVFKLPGGSIVRVEAIPDKLSVLR